MKNERFYENSNLRKRYAKVEPSESMQEKKRVRFEQEKREVIVDGVPSKHEDQAANSKQAGTN